jgi:hypothetical protein
MSSSADSDFEAAFGVIAITMLDRAMNALNASYPEWMKDNDTETYICDLIADLLLLGLQNDLNLTTMIDRATLHATHDAETILGLDIKDILG